MTDFVKMWAEEPMKKPKVDKVVVNIGVGSGGDLMEPAMKLIEKLTGKKPVQTYSKHKIPAWGLRLGLPIGTKVTLRGKDARDFLARSFSAVENVINEKNFDDVGNLSFGIEQYVFYDGVKYDPGIGTMGLQVSITLERPGFRIKRRKVRKTKIGKSHLILKDEAMAFIAKEFGVTIENE
jgi:large subunit ribosomal protein L5